MKTPVILTIIALLAALPSCDRQSSATGRRIAELERKNQQAADRQSELEQQIQDQKLAAEREAIERERAQIEADRLDLERQAGQAAADQEEALRKREAEMSNREGRLEELQSSLNRKDDELGTKDQELTKRDRELAGREAINPEASDPGEPVGDYGTFYDSLASYGSWFDTADYGYVWQPAVVNVVNWRPYSRGRWVCSDRGWNWISDEPFGWATYHYGRWALLRGRGWIWVPGTEWAPCWVSWRENDSHIGWAPLPPETMGWRGNGWDNNVDVRYGIGAAWFTFVEVQYFGGPLYQHCLPLSGNGGWYGSTVNITNIHIRNSLIICGGPRYDRICKRIGRPLPFYRLEVDHHPRLGRDLTSLRPQVHGGKLRISAPNLNAEWNEGMRPKKVRSRIDKVDVEREKPIDTKISDRFQQSRVEGRQQAEKAIARQGGRERFEQNHRGEKLAGRVPEVAGRPGTGNPGIVQKQDRSTGKNDIHVLPPPAGKEEMHVLPPPPVGKEEMHVVPPPPADPRLPGGVTRREDENGGRAKETGITRQQPNVAPERPNVAGRTEQNPNPSRRVTPDVPPTRQQKQADRVTPGKRAEIEIPQRQEPSRQGNPNREAQNDAARQQQAELARQRQQQQEKQRQDDQAKETRRQAADQQARQQQAARDEQQQRQEARQQQEAQQMREAARQQQENQRRQQDEARQQQENDRRQRQQDDARQQQQQENQRRQQDEARQQQENQQRQQQQQQQEQNRRQEESRQRQEQSRQQQQSDDQDSSRRRNR